MRSRILVVDDEPAILFALSALLCARGYEVETAATGKEAVLKIATTAYELILTDMRMETDTSGYEVVRAAVNSQVVVAILTADALGCRDWREQGAQALLEKPIGAENLLREVDVLLTRARCSCSPRPVGQALKRLPLSCDFNPTM